MQDTTVDQPTEPLPYVPAQHDWDAHTLRQRPNYSPRDVISARVKIREQLVRRNQPGVCPNRHRQPGDES